MKQRDIMDLMDSIAPVIAASFLKAMAPMAARLEAIDKRLDALRASPSVEELAALAGAHNKLAAELIDMQELVTGLPGPDGLMALVDKAVDAKVAMIEPAAPGKDADPEAVRAMIAEELAKTVPTAEAVAALVPPAVAGKDADPEVTAGLVRDAVAAVMTPMQIACDAAIRDVRAVGEAVEALPRPADGKSVTLDDVRPLVVELVDGLRVEDIIAAGFAALPTLRDGKDVDPEAVAVLVVTEVEKAVSALAPAENGKDADPAAIVAEVERQMAARPGPQDGKSVTVEELRPVVEEVVQAAVSALPPAKDGKNVEPEAVVEVVTGILATWPKPKDGTSVTLEDCLPALQEAVAALPVAKDGVGLAGALLDSEGHLVVTLTDGAMVKLGLVVGKDGDVGLGFDDLDVVDEPMHILLRFSRGDQIKEFAIAKPTLADMHKGVWREGAHKRGTVVTWGGSQWLAMVDTEAKPETTKDWVLVVKRGRDGKDVAPLEPKEPTKVKLR